MSDVIFVTYASGSYRKNIYWNRFFVRNFLRPTRCLFFTEDDLQQSAVYADNKTIFDSKIGAGYWAWKPWAILRAMEGAPDGGVVIYQDCGAGIKYKNILQPSALIEHALKYGAMPGVLVPNHGENRDWTHSECFRLMGCEGEAYAKTAQVEASISVWVVSEKSKEFLREWLMYCLNIDVVGDGAKPQAASFRCHRYDQSVLTNLVVKHQMKPVFYAADVPHLSKSLSLMNFLCSCKPWARGVGHLFVWGAKMLRKARI